MTTSFNSIPFTLLSSASIFCVLALELQASTNRPCSLFSWAKADMTPGEADVRNKIEHIIETAQSTPEIAIARCAAPPSYCFSESEVQVRRSQALQLTVSRSKGWAGTPFGAPSPHICPYCVRYSALQDTSSHT